MRERACRSARASGGPIAGTHGFRGTCTVRRRWGRRPTMDERPCSGGAREPACDDMIPAMRALSLLAIALGAARRSPPSGRCCSRDGVSPEALERRRPAAGSRWRGRSATSDVAAESALADVRPLYRDMAFGRAVARLEAAEQALIDGRLPTPRLAGALAEIELWLGACLLLDNKAAEAHERFALARALAPTARPDRIFPPEVPAAFARATPGARVTPRVALSPPGARVWIDGQPAEPATTRRACTGSSSSAPIGGRWRASCASRRRRPRSPSAWPTPPRRPTPSVRRSCARPSGPLGSDEALALSAALGRTLWIVGAHGADRFAAGDVAHPTRHVAFAGDPVDAVCAAEPVCLAARPAAQPIYKRAALWVPIAAGVVVIVGAGVLAGTLANTQLRLCGPRSLAPRCWRSSLRRRGCGAAPARRRRSPSTPAAARSRCRPAARSSIRSRPTAPARRRRLVLRRLPRRRHADQRQRRARSPSCARSAPDVRRRPSGHARWPCA